LPGPIILDIGTTHTKVVQLTAARRRRLLVDAAIAPNAPLPSHWAPSPFAPSADTEPGTITRSLTRLADRLRHGLELARLLAPELRGNRVVAMLPDEHYVYRVEQPSRSDANAPADGTPIEAVTDHHWTRIGAPPCDCDLQRLSAGLRIGIDRDAVRQVRTIVDSLGWDLDSVISPISAIAGADRTDGAGLSLIDGAGGTRIVLHVDGTPILTRRLRNIVGSASIRPNEVRFGIEPRDRCGPKQRQERQNLLITEIERTIAYVARRAPLSIVRGIVHGPVAFDTTALERLSRATHVDWHAWAPPDDLVVDPIEDALPLYSVALSAALVTGVDS